MRFLRTMAQLRTDYNIALPQNKDSEYKEIHREERIFPNLIISKTLEENLPFKAKNKVKTLIEGKSEKYVEDDTFLMKKLKLPTKKLKNVLTDKEKDAYSLLQRLQTLKNLKVIFK
jgi:ribosome biogenesis protein BMS1